MAAKAMNNIKLGTFVLSGLLFLVLLLYMIGKNEHLFGSNFELKAVFSNVQGLITGNNVRFSGIGSGTVKKISIINDTTIEVTMVIDKKMQGIIRKNAIASIGTEGLVGNKVVNIVPAKETSPYAEEGDMLVSKKAVNTDEMLQTLYKTNNEIAAISTDLKTTVKHINSSSALWELLNDKSIPDNIRRSLVNIRRATGKAGEMVNNIDAIVTDVKSGKGSVGVLLNDSSLAKNLNEAVIKIKSAGSQADSLVEQINGLVKGIKKDMDNGKGTIHLLLKDSVMAERLNASLDNIQQGTDGFNQNMEALKHSIFFRRYFRKLERQKKKEDEKNQTKN